MSDAQVRDVQIIRDARTGRNFVRACWLDKLRPSVWQFLAGFQIWMAS